MKYRFQYGALRCDTILPYDNFPDHPDAPIHHRHTREEGIEGINFETVGQSKRPTLWYDTIEVDLPLLASEGDSGTADT